MESCPELIITPCSTCDLHIVSYLYRKDDGRVQIVCPKCDSTIFDREAGDETERFIRNQRSYYAIAAEVEEGFDQLEMPGDSMPIVHPVQGEA